MKRVDKDPSRVKSHVEDSGYHVPEPALMISGGSPERRQLFMANWLAVRKFWFNHLEEDAPSQHPTSQQWRDFLIRSQSPSRSGSSAQKPIASDSKDEAGPSNGKGKGKTKTKAQQRQSGLSQVFAEGIFMTQGSDLAKDSMEWRGQSVSFASLANPPVHLVRAILWELFELGFHLELRAIDRAMVPDLWVKYSKTRCSLLECVWPGPRGETKWESSLPRQRGDLGFTDVVLRNRQVFNSFCLVLSAWPGAHPSLYAFATAGGSDVTQQAAYGVLSRALLFYAQCFFDRFGRPPIVPHAFPLDFHHPISDPLSPV